MSVWASRWLARACVCTRPCVCVYPLACVCTERDRYGRAGGSPVYGVCVYPPTRACVRDRYGRAGGSPVRVCVPARPCMCVYPPACACMCAYVSVRPCPLGRATGSPLPVTICDVPASGMGCLGCSDGRSRDDLDLVLWFRSSRGARFCMMAG